MSGINPMELYQNLPQVKVGHNDYGKLDRYQDFESVFFGKSDAKQGQRVYRQIMDLCEPPMPSPDDIRNHGALAELAGRQIVGRTIASYSEYNQVLRQTKVRN